MVLKLSQLIGMDIYTDNAQFVGKVYDVIIDLQKGEVVRLTLAPIKATNKDEARQVFHEKTVLYKSVKAVEKIIIISNAPVMEPEEELPAKAPVKQTYQPYSYKYKRT